MLNILVDYAVPGCVFLLMLIAGTDVIISDFSRVSKNSRAVVLGSAGQLLTLPGIALLVQSIATPAPSVALGILLLSLCPSGGISNYYAYLARANVLLSATITATGTALSLLTIPLWLKFLPALPSVAAHFPGVPSKIVLAQLFALMIVPMAIGIFLRHRFAASIQAVAKLLRFISLGIILIVLALGITSVFDRLSLLLLDIFKSAFLFIVFAMILGWCLSYGLSARDRPVLVIESAVRNVGVALIMGSSLLSKDDFGIFASFIAGYFMVEIAIMLIYARYKANETPDFPAEGSPTK